VASLALTIQAQDITNTLSATGNFKVNKNDGTTNLFTLSETGDHIMQLSTSSSAFTIKNGGGQAAFEFDDHFNMTDLAMIKIGNANINWLGNNFAHLQLQSQNSIVDNKFNMVARGATNHIEAYFAKGTGAAPTDVAHDDILLYINSYGYNNGGNRHVAGIGFIVDGAPNGNFVPGKINFHTGTDAVGPALRMTIKSDGKVGIGTETPTSTLDVDGSITLAINSGTSNYTLTDSDYTYITNSSAANGADVILPTAVGIEGRVYIVKNTGTGEQIVYAQTGEFIDAGANYGLTQWKFVKVQSDGSNWIVIGESNY